MCRSTSAVSLSAAPGTEESTCPADVCYFKFLPNLFVFRGFVNRRSLARKMLQLKLTRDSGLERTIHQMSAVRSAMDALISAEVLDLHDTAANLNELCGVLDSPTSEHSLMILLHGWADLQERLDRMERMLDSMDDSACARIP